MRDLLAFAAVIAVFSSLARPTAGQEPLAFEEVGDWQAEEVEPGSPAYAAEGASFALSSYAYSSSCNCCNDAWAGYCEEQQQGCCGLFDGGLRCRLAIWKDQIFGSRCGTCCDCRPTSCGCTTDEGEFEIESDDMSYSHVQLLTPPPSHGADRVAVMHTARRRGTAKNKSR